MIHRVDFLNIFLVLPKGNVPAMIKSNTQVYRELLWKDTETGSTLEKHCFLLELFLKASINPLVIILFLIIYVPNLNYGLLFAANWDHQEFGAIP